MWTDPGVKSGISVRELIPNLKKKEEKNVTGREPANPPLESSHRGKIPPTLFQVCCLLDTRGCGLKYVLAM